ncbi:hypothetical protein LY02_02874 [Nonlabens ulvanivorans]|uniref:Uncharacterized protein n=1 Tax=Nonlabens ulvanivorans TaxID=906888 RepID=A0ABX5E0W1_NONUL|nr:hypothetical protein LY02_02874 [Nonlabens ulvanivorans]
MQTIFEIFIKQILCVYTGSFILFLYFKMKGNNITWLDVLKKKDNKGNLVNENKSFFIGVVFWILFIALLSVTLG